MKFKKAIGILVLLVLVSYIIIKRSDRTDNENFMNAQFDQITELIKNRDQINKKVSAVDIAWHLDYLLKVVKSLHHSLEISDPNQYESEFNIRKIAVFVSGTIPRGVGKVRDLALPPEEIKTEDILRQSEEAKSILQNYNQLPVNAFFKHPVFGVLNRQQTKRLIEIHTNHHLKIIRDIIE